MTREEAKALLESRRDLIKSDYPEIDDYREALDMEIKALEQKPYEKFESAKDHIYKLAGDYKCWDNRLTKDEAVELCHILEQQPCEDTISRQAAISAICNACGKIDCDKMDKCEKLQLPPANCSEIPNNSDTISRQAAIDAFNTNIDELVVAGKENADAVERYLNRVIDEIKQLPSAQPATNCSEIPNGSDDTISRQAAIDAVCKACSLEGDYHKCDGYPETSTWCDELVALRALPSAQPEQEAIDD